MAPAPAVPPSLKKIKVFLTRASELDRDAAKNPESRVVAYNCRQYAVLTGIPLSTDPAAKACLGDLLGALEEEKAAMSVFTRAEHRKICRKVADKVFDGADSQDRAGGANKATAKGFYAAGTFYEILQQFYDEEKAAEEQEEDDDETRAQREEEEQRRLYCKWKATEILNAIKEGRTPEPGGYRQQEEEETAEEEDGQLPLPPDNNDGGGLPSINEGLPPPPSMPTSDFYSAEQSNNETHKQTETTNDASNGMMPPPPAYGGIELDLNGEPTVEDVDEGDEDSGTEDVYIPGAAMNAANNNVFVDVPSPAAPPPPYPDHAARSSYDATPSLPPPAATRPLPPPVAPSGGAGVFSSLFGGKSSRAKLNKEQMADAVELTKFALAALQKGDGELGRERLEQALGVWRR